MTSTDRLRGSRGVLTGLLAVALVVTFAATVQASVLRALTVEELRAGADAIVSGKVVGVRSVRSGGSVETVARVRVRRSWRGDEDRLVVRVPGGLVDGRRVIVPGAPAFERGQEVLLFLVRDGRSWRPLGLFQGVWRLDPDRPEIAFASPSGGAALMRPEGTTVAAVDRAERDLVRLVGTAGGER